MNLSEQVEEIITSTRLTTQIKITQLLAAFREAQLSEKEIAEIRKKAHCCDNCIKAIHKASLDNITKE